jgi:translation initiation factor 2D
MVKLDPFLANSVFDSSDKGGSKNAAVDKEAIARGQVPRDVLSQRVLDACSPFHLILRNGTQDASAKPKSGAPPKISITLETRSGNKTATKVSGLETYGIAPQPLADELRKACAGSTSVERLQGSSPKAPVMEVMIQGPQAEAVKKALARRGVEERWIEVNDKTKGKGKGR